MTDPASAAAPFTREEFERRRGAMERVLKRGSWAIAAVSVTLGLGQLGLIRWAETRLPRRLEITLEGGAFLAYIALLLVMAWRLGRKLRAARVLCPRCGAALEGLSERVAGATGKCDRCGGQVIA